MTVQIPFHQINNWTSVLENTPVFFAPRMAEDVLRRRGGPIELPASARFEPAEGWDSVINIFGPNT